MRTTVPLRRSHAAAVVRPCRGLVGSFSRRHIDLQRVAAALCTG
ncbi:putative leader peptide [Streptacidiphilus sp. PB12-B1b]|nr:putative leader peptide [Streptacidiphilus sp. PB12-B1b]